MHTLSRCDLGANIRKVVAEAIDCDSELAGEFALAFLGTSITRSGFEQVVRFAEYIDREAVEFWSAADGAP